MPNKPFLILLASAALLAPGQAGNPQEATRTGINNYVSQLKPRSEPTLEDIELEHNKPVDVWLIPTVEFPEQSVKLLIKRIKENMGLHARASIPAGVDVDLFFSDKTQICTDRALQSFSKIVPSLEGDNKKSIYIILTSHDANGESREFRYLFAANNKLMRMGLVSNARMKISENPPFAPGQQVEFRLFKMVKRQIGELHFNLPRSSNRNNVMYSPVMGLDDLDMIDSSYRK